MPGPESPYAPPANGGADDRPAATGSGRPLPSSLVAAVLTFFVRGTGHVYAGELGRGIAWAATSIGLTLVLAVTQHDMRGPLVLATIAATFFVTLLLHVVAMVAAARTAARTKRPRAPLPIVLLAGAVFLASNVTVVALVRALFVEAFKIPSGSMMPTLLVGDHIFVDKMHKGGRGDVIVFPYPEHPDQDFVKRIIATAGDRIEFDDSHPIVNGVRVPSCRVGTWTYTEDSMQHSGELYAEAIGSHPYLAFYDTATIGYGHQGPWVVKAGELFVVGDNRNNAHDSRMWFGGLGGGVSAESVRGVALDVWVAMTDEGVDLVRVGLPLDQPNLPQSAAALAPDLAKCLETLRGQ